MWLKIKLHIHNKIYRRVFTFYITETKTCKTIIFFSEIINRKSNKARTLFSVVDRRINPASIPSELLSKHTCNDFAAFFSDKITKIRETVCGSCSGNMTVTSVPPRPQVSPAHFNLLVYTALTEIISQFKV